MENEGLTFLEAVQALIEGKCDDIESDYTIHYICKLGKYVSSRSLGFGTEPTIEEILGRWKLNYPEED